MEANEIACVRMAQPIPVHYPAVLKYARVRDVPSPIRKTPKAAGFDICIPNFSPEFSCELYKNHSCGSGYDNDTKRDFFTIPPKGMVKIPSGLKVAIPAGWFLLLTPKSGVGIRTQTTLLADTIDEDYQGEIGVVLQNLTEKTQRFYFGQAVVQAVLLPVAYVDLVETSEDQLHPEATQRGDGGFGSTGIFHESFPK